MTCGQQGSYLGEPQTSTKYITREAHHLFWEVDVHELTAPAEGRASGEKITARRRSREGFADGVGLRESPVRVPFEGKNSILRSGTILYAREHELRGGRVIQSGAGRGRTGGEMRDTMKSTILWGATRPPLRADPKAGVMVAGGG